MPIKLSVTTKLDGIPSWSLQAGDTCPGSYTHDNTPGKPKTLVPACAGCYAKTGNYVFANVKAPRLHNRADWKRDDWVTDMVLALSPYSHFRWFDSGDTYAIRLAKKILDVVKRTPWCKHWIPTRMVKFDKYRPILAAINAQPNAVVRFSSDAVDGTFTPGLHGSTIISSLDQLQPGVTLCRAYTRTPARCAGCRACWDKSVPVIAYMAHGRTMAKVVRLQADNAATATK